MSLPQFTLTECQDDFGSRYLAGRLSPDSVLNLAGLKLEKMFRRVILDPARADGFVEAHPPDLVVEIGVTPFDRDKQVVYRKLGVTEYWQARVSRRRDNIDDMELTFLALDSDAPEVPLPVSRVLPGLTPEAVAAAARAGATAEPEPESRSAAIAQALRDHSFPRSVAATGAQGENELQP